MTNQRRFKFIVKSLMNNRWQY